MYSVQTKRFSSLDVICAGNSGCGHSKPVDVTFAELPVPGSVAEDPAPPQAVRIMLATAKDASIFMMFAFLISTSFR
jgi:hypothetical protein